MPLRAYYNEVDPYCCAWLRNLIKAGLIMDGEIDARPIQDVKPNEVRKFIRCHFYAGIAGWDLALTQAGWPVDRPVWTGSNPCQPFSTAGARRGFADERHLWPFWFHLIGVCRPPTVFGEQVANGSGPWLDLVLPDLESADYAVGAAVLPACSVGASHERQRVWFVADLDSEAEYVLSEYAKMESASKASSNLDAKRLSGRREAGTNGAHAAGLIEGGRFGLDDARVVSRDDWAHKPVLGRGVHGVPFRLERVCAYGNAIVPQVAATFIKAYLECRP